MTPPFLRKTAFPLLSILILGFLVYSGTFRAPFALDDGDYIVHNPALRVPGYILASPDAAPASMEEAVRYALRTRAVGFLTFALNYRLHGLDVAGYHAVNILIHLLNALLVYALATLTFRTPWFAARATEGDAPGAGGDRGGIAFFTALLFAVHPVQTQAVSYITQRFASLATLFCLLSLTTYVRSRLSPTPAGRYGLYTAALASALLAMFTKEISFTLPVVLLLYEFSFLAGVRGRRVLYTAPFLLSMAVIPLTLMAAGGAGGLGDSMEALGTGAGMSRWDYLITQFRVIVTYLRLMVLPVNQNLDYDYPVYRSFYGPPVLLSFLFLLAILLLGGWLYRRSKAAGPEGRPELRLVSFGIFWFFVTLSVESSVVPIADVIFEHRLYLPSVGFLLAGVTSLFLGKAALERRLPVAGKAFVPVLAAVSLLLAGAAYARNSVWKDGVSLWEDVVRKSPGKARPHNNLGNFYQERGRLEDAAREFREAIRLDPGNAESRYNLGNACSLQDRFEEAIPHFQGAIRLRPAYAEAHHNLGVTYKRLGRYEDAVREFRSAIALRPGYAEAHYNLGNANALRGDLDGAIREFEAAIRHDPGHADAARNREIAVRMRNQGVPQQQPIGGDRMDASRSRKTGQTP